MIQNIGPCLVDGCMALITMDPDWPTQTWMVRHGEGEAARCFTSRELFITHGYAPWVREVHAFEAAREQD